jgi:hypothetical protein
MSKVIDNIEDIASIDSKVVKVTSTDNAVVRFDGTTGQVQNSGVVIDDNANVGIAVTPSAYIGIPTIQVGKTAFLNGDGYVGDWGMSLSNNAAATGGNAFKYANPFQPSAYRQFEGSHFWYTAPSGTAGNPITWNTAMTLGSNGNLLVGKTTDNGADKLQVNGSISQKSNVIDNKHIRDYGHTTDAYPSFATITLPNYGVVDICVTVTSADQIYTCRFRGGKAYVGAIVSSAFEVYTSNSNYMGTVTATPSSNTIVLSYIASGGSSGPKSLTVVATGTFTSLS